MRSNKRDQPDGDAGRRLVALIGWWCVAIGIAGLVFHRNLLYLWIVLIAFGLAELPRSLWRWVRNRRRTP